MKIKTRRTFLKAGVALIAAFTSYLWHRVTLETSGAGRRKPLQILLKQQQTVLFADDFILINQNNNITVLSAFCTHLGCRIDKSENDRLVCPCHGSVYNFSGEVVSGPAYKNLSKVPFKISPDGTKIEIEK